MKVTAVLITRDAEFPKEVLDSLPEFDEILIETNCQSIHRRYELALKAKNDVIYVQDDDCIIDVKELYEHYNGQITNALTEHHKGFYGGLGMTLIGFGAFFPKSMIDFTKYLDVYGANPLFLSQTDRVFTFLNKPFNTVVMDIKHLPSATAPNRMSTQADHWNNLNNIREQLCKLDQ